MEALRSWAGVFSEFGRRFGADAGMHVTDSEALIHIINAEDKGDSLNQTQLRRRIGLSSGATSSLLNRLEESGHIERRRDQTDRRLVTLRSTPSVHRRVEEFFADVSEDINAVLLSYPTSTIDEFADVVRDMTTVMDRHLKITAS